MSLLYDLHIEEESNLARRLIPFTGARYIYAVMGSRDALRTVRIMDDAGRLLAWYDEGGDLYVIEETPTLLDLEAPDALDESGRR